MGQEQRKKTSQREFLNELLGHARDFLEFHKKNKLQTRKRAHAVKQFLESKEKKKQQLEDKEEKKRIQELKIVNLNSYLELIKSTKNSRLLEILDQTHRFLESLGAKVKIQKIETAMLARSSNPIRDPNNQTKEESKEGKGEENQEESKQEDEEEDKEEEEEVDNLTGEKIAAKLKNSSQVYYSVTHSVKEEVVTQPKMLIGGTLKNYQLVGLQWLVSLYNNNLNGILADEMGLGKTIQSIALLCFLVETKRNQGPYLLVVPLTTLSNWKLEFEKWAPSIRIVIYKGSPQVRQLLAQRLRNERFNVVLTTYEYVMKDKSVLSKYIWQYIIVDEGHRMKNSQSKFAMTLGQQYQSCHRLLLTGTPLQNDLSELWALLNFLLPKIFGSCDDFKKWFNQPFQRMPNEKVELNEEEQLLIINRLHQVLQPFLLRRVKKEVEKQLPDKQEYVIKVELSGWQRIIYEQITKYGVMATSDPRGLKTKALQNTMMQLRKICNHPYLFLTESVLVDQRIISSSGKFELLDRMLPKMISTGHKTLIFSQMVQLLDVLQAFLQFRNISFLRLDGSTKEADREKTMQMFNTMGMEYPVFLLSTRAGGQGLNLQSADSVIIFDLDWNPAMDIQAEDRAHRIGQQREVRVYRLVTKTSIEKEILNKAAFKKMMDAKIIQAGLFNTKADERDRRKRLEQIFEGENSSDEEGEEDAIPNDEQINEMIARDNDEFDKFQKMDQEMYEAENRDQRIKELLAVQEVRNYLGSYKHINYRLLYEHEVPDWVKNIKKPKQMGDMYENLEQFGFGKRQRKEVKYDDGLTDLQFQKIIESGKDYQKEVEKMQEEKRKRELGPPNVLDDDEDDDELESESEDDEDDSEEEANNRLVHLQLNTRKSREISDSESVEPQVVKKEVKSEYQGEQSSPRRITRSAGKHSS